MYMLKVDIPHDPTPTAVSMRFCWSKFLSAAVTRALDVILVATDGSGRPVKNVTEDKGEEQG